jgi:pimeloyl-ACP methyl ester carboxylesterase
MQERFDELNGVKLHSLQDGIGNKDIIIFLHGFPEYSYAWHKQLTFFANQGFHAIAPDQRGYNLSSKPAGIKAYVIDNLVADIALLIKQLTPNQVTLVGHDWGGAVAWALAIKHPELLKQLVILNMPHLAVMKKHLRSNYKQMLKSWYAMFFQLPFLPEFFCSVANNKFLVRSLIKTSNKGTFSKQDFTGYQQAWQQPNALTSMINWYRASKYNVFKANDKVTVPTLIVWGKNDTFLNAQMAHDSLAMCTNGKLLMIDNATHWLHHEKPDEINSLILNFINSNSTYSNSY